MSATTDITVVLPACAWPDPSDMSNGPRPTLLRVLDSVVLGAEATGAFAAVRPEILVGVDGYAQKVIATVEEWGTAHPGVALKVHWFERPPWPSWGHRQRNAMLDARMPSSPLIAYQDDDDAFYPGALAMAVARAREHPGRPLMFRMRLHRPGLPPVLWRTKGAISLGHVAAQMLVTPNEPELLGRWEPATAYDADFAFVSQTVGRFEFADRPLVWLDDFITRYDVRDDAVA